MRSGMVVGTAVMGKPKTIRSGRLARQTSTPTCTTERQFIAAPDRSHWPTRTRILWAAPPRASSTTSIAFTARGPGQPDSPLSSATLARETHVSDLAADQQTQDPDQLLLLRRLRPRDPEEDPGRARAGSQRERRDIVAMASRYAKSQPALGGQRLDDLQQQGQAGPAVRAVLQPTPTASSSTSASASARSSSTIRSNASSPPCIPTTPGRRSSSIRGGRRPRM